MQIKLNDKDTISALQDQVKEISEKYPLFIAFLEELCGYNTPGMTSEPNMITYQAGKRDVILTLKTLGRRDILPEEIAKFYERNR